MSDIIREVLGCHIFTRVGFPPQEKDLPCEKIPIGFCMYCDSKVCQEHGRKIPDGEGLPDRVICFFCDRDL